MNSETKQLIIEARHKLHAMPELSCSEINTKAFIIEFLKEHTTLEIHDMGRWVYAAHREAAGETVALRADFDAVQTECGAAHRCGHDGHTAALLGLALTIEGRQLGKSVILLFQHAEETGIGGEECCALFDREHIDVIYGCHNIPGEAMGTVLLRNGTFACASCGIEITMRGKPTHAAYPENGVNPTGALAVLALELNKIAERTEKKNNAMTLSTIVGMYSGEKAFGVAASKGAVFATLRSEKTECLDELIRKAKQLARELAEKDGLEISLALYDKFPATVNPEEGTNKLEMVCKENAIAHKYLEKPFRWSEDFGHYGSKTKAVFFGIGSGETTAPLHTEGYEYPDELAEKTVEVFDKIISDRIQKKS